MAVKTSGNKKAKKIAFRRKLKKMKAKTSVPQRPERMYGVGANP